MPDPYLGILSADFETASAVSIKVGSWAYSQHPSTVIHCAVFVYATSATSPRQRFYWQPGMEFPAPVRDYIRAGGTMLAHNVGFEKSIWANIIAKVHRIPAPCSANWRDTAAMGLALNLPLKLEGLCKALGTPIKKDMEGHALMLAMSKALPDGDGGWLYDRDPVRQLRLLDYCETDCDGTLDAFFRMPKMSLFEERVWLMDQRINERGLLIDRPFAAACLELAGLRAAELSTEAFGASMAEIENATATPSLKRWLRELEIELPKTKRKKADGTFHMTESIDKNTVVGLLADGTLPPSVRKVLEIRQEANKATSLAKLKRVEHMVGTDGRLRHALMFCGANTGRWTSDGLQVHNLPKDHRKPNDSALVRAMIMHRSMDGLKMVSQRPLEGLSMSLRAMIVAPPGKELIGGDFSQIEARVLPWLAGQDDVTAAFARGVDIYTVTAKEKLGSDDRQLGKLAVLSLGFGTGEIKLADTASKPPYFIHLSLKEAKRIKTLWREANPKIVQFWADLAESAKFAIRQPGTVFQAGERIAFWVEGNCLFLRLPSGRSLRYWRPRIVEAEKTFKFVDDFGEIQEKTVLVEQIEYFAMGKDKKSMVRESTYGGKLCVAGGTLVLTDRGWVRLDCVTLADRVHDGVEFVSHSGLIAKGEKTCIEVDGAWMTPDHEVLTADGWRQAASDPVSVRPEIPIALPERIPEERWTFRPHQFGMFSAVRFLRTSTSSVFDLTNCGPRRRFVIAGEKGPVVVSNCENLVQGTAREIMAAGLLRVDAVEPYEIIAHVHDSAAAEVPDGAGSPDQFCEIMAESPPWAAGLPIVVNGYRSRHFQG